MKSAAVLFVLALLMAACTTDTTIQSTSNGGSSAESSESAPAEEPESEPAAQESESQESEPEAEPAEAAAEPTPEPAATEPPAPTVDTSSAAAQIGADDWCTAAQLVEDRFDAVDVAFGDPETLKEAYLEASVLIRQARELAPPVIAADVDTTIRGVELLIGVLEAAEWDFLAVDFSDLDALDDEMNTASYNIEKYNFDVCGIGEEPTEPLLDDGIFEDDSGEPLTGTVGDQITQGLVDSGFTEAEATCILDRIDLADPEAMADLTAMLGVFEECGISIERLAQLGG